MKDIRSMASLDDLREQWNAFRAEDCDCYNQADKENILELINNTGGGIPDFNDKVSDECWSLHRRETVTFSLLTYPSTTHLSNWALWPRLP